MAELDYAGGGKVWDLGGEEFEGFGVDGRVLIRMKDVYVYVDGMGWDGTVYKLWDMY